MDQEQLWVSFWEPADKRWPRNGVGRWEPFVAVDAGTDLAEWVADYRAGDPGPEPTLWAMGIDGDISETFDELLTERAATLANQREDASIEAQRERVASIVAELGMELPVWVDEALSEAAFRAGADEVIAANAAGFPRETAGFNVDTAWAAYRRDPAAWAGGTPALDMFMAEGPWHDDDQDGGL